jgi:signal transduction histidine kinase
LTKDHFNVKITRFGKSLKTMMKLKFTRDWTRSPSIKVMTVLGLALVVINAIGIWDIVSSKRNAETLALQELKLQAMANALSIESILSSRRGDFIFLSQSKPIGDAPSVLSDENPITRRWGRLDVEGSLLLFLVAHAEVERLIIRDSRSRPLVVAGRRDGAPVLLPAREYIEPARSREGILVGSWPLRAAQGEPGTLETVMDVTALLKTAVPGLSPQFVLHQQALSEGGNRSTPEQDSFLISIPVDDDGWPVPIHWSLVCESTQSHLLESITALADRYRISVILNLIIMSLALIVGFVGFQQVRRTMALEEQNRQQGKVRELERQVMHNERLASIGRLAAGMAHEINNPLEGMANYLSLLEDDLQAGKTDGLLEMTARVREGLERAAGIMRQVLNFADPGSAPHAPLDLNEVLEETASFVRSNPSFRQIEVVLNKCQGPLLILGNQVTLGQLFLNLLINACQVQPDGGQVTVASLQHGDRAVVLVADCGPGIPEESKSRIFEPFFSTRGSTGLGLFVCHGIVEEHRGKITVQNRIGGGTVFSVEFPLESERELQQSVAEIA